MVDVTAYRVLGSSKVTPVPVVVYLSPGSKLPEEPYMDLAQLPTPVQVIIVHALWDRYAFDVRTISEGQTLYVRLNELETLTGGKVGALTVEPPRDMCTLN